MNANPSAYLWLYPAMKTSADNLGWCLVVHGSLNNDFDLIAVPWKSNICPVQELIDDICRITGGTLERGPDHKPHGRTCFAIRLTPKMFIDLSVMNSSHIP
jgi:hypothetical protein